MFASLSPQFRNSQKFVRENINREAKIAANNLAKMLTKLFYGFRQKAMFRNLVSLRLNQMTISKIAVNICEDILRVECYHHYCPADKHKIAAYAYKWISRLRPIETNTGDPHLLSDAERNANSHFAVLFVLSCLNIETLNKIDYYQLIYTAEYRDINPLDWSLIFYLIEEKQRLLAEKTTLNS